MAIVDKRGYLSRLNDATLELGCGPRKRHPEAVTIDAIDYACVDIVGDVFEVLSHVPDHQINAVQNDPSGNAGVQIANFKYGLAHGEKGRGRNLDMFNGCC